MSEPICAICLDTLAARRKKIYTADCQHKFHETCFRRMNNIKCPCCRVECTPSVDHQLTLLRDTVKTKRQNHAEIKRICYWQIRKKEYNVYLLIQKLRQARIALKLAHREQRTLLETSHQDIRTARDAVTAHLQCPELVARRRARHQKNEFERRWYSKCQLAYISLAESHSPPFQKFLKTIRKTVTAAWKRRLRQHAVEVSKTGIVPWSDQERTRFQYEYFMNYDILAL